VNLIHNGVSIELPNELITVGFHIESRQLSERGDLMLMLWRAVERAGRVVMYRCRLMGLPG
jgi:RNA-dependent RNA polymerase